jgi:chromosome segregation ATPase
MEALMSDTETFLNRISRLFKRPARPNGNGDSAEPTVTVETRSVALRPWRRNQAAITQLQQGFASLTELMTSIRQHMDAQGRRQDELLAHLSALPRVMESIPESNRLQGEALKAIHEQLLHHANQQETLGEILQKLSEAGGEHKELLDGLRERVETISYQDKAMAESLNTVGSALESVSRNSAASTEVLGHLSNNLRTRDGELEQILHRQGSRFTTLLVIAIVLSVAALASVSVFAYLLMHNGIRTS